MAFGKGNASTEGFDKKLYEGFASCRILTVNPTAKEIEKYRGFLPKDEPVYTSEVEVDGKTVKQLRLDVLLQVNQDKYLDNEGNKIDVVLPMTMFLRNTPKVGKNTGKTQIMDKYARTSWATPQELEQHAIPTTKSGPARISPDYKIVRDGEAEICNMLQCQLNINSVEKWEKENGNNIYKGLVDNPQECECYIDNIEKLLNGDVSEIKDAFSLMPDNEFKVLFYVRRSDDGKLYQAAYTSEFLRNRISKYDKFASQILDAQSRGSFAGIDFYFGEFREFSVTPTNFTQNNENTSGMPQSTPW